MTLVPAATGLLEKRCAAAGALCGLLPSFIASRSRNCTIGLRWAAEFRARHQSSEGRPAHRLLGNSITQKGDFISGRRMLAFEQGIQVEVLNLGLGSESAATLTPEENKGHLAKYGFGRPAVSERLARVLAETKPDMVFVAMA